MLTFICSISTYYRQNFGQNGLPLCETSKSFCKSFHLGFEEAGKLVTGVVVQVRRKVDRLQIWTSSFDDSESLISIGKKYKTVLKFDENRRVLQYQRHSDSVSKHGSTTRAILQVQPVAKRRCKLKVKRQTSSLFECIEIHLLNENNTSQRTPNPTYYYLLSIRYMAQVI